MTWTYSNSPATIQRDEVRLLSGDTDSTRSSSLTLSDEEIAYFISEEGSGAQAAIAACEALAAKWSSQPESQRTGGISITNGDMAEKFRAQARMLRSSKLRPTPYLGGQSSADKNIDRDDTDNVGPRFYRGQGRDAETQSSYDASSNDEATS